MARDYSFGGQFGHIPHAALQQFCDAVYVDQLARVFFWRVNWFALRSNRDRCRFRSCWLPCPSFIPRYKELNDRFRDAPRGLQFSARWSLHSYQTPVVSD
jgi:hypothetical protein